MSQAHQCGRCGGDIERILCDRCDGSGHTEPGELHDVDPLWYDEGDVEQCNQCAGVGGWWVCSNSADWCEQHPMPGRAEWPGGKVESFEVDGP